MPTPSFRRGNLVGASGVSFRGWANVGSGAKGPGRKAAIEDQVAALVRDILARRTDGLGLDRVEFDREGGQWFLRVFLDHPGGVTIEHCEEVSRELGEVLDRVDPIEDAYSLEVSSPGLERPLRNDADYERFRGRLVSLHLYRAVGGKKILTGRLEGLDGEGRVVLEIGSGAGSGRGAADGAGETLRIPRAAVAKAHLAVDWAEPEKAHDKRGKTAVRDNGGGDQ